MSKEFIMKMGIRQDEVLSPLCLSSLGMDEIAKRKTSSRNARAGVQNLQQVYILELMLWTCNN